MNLTPQEAFWLLGWFRANRKRLPSGQTYAPHFDATSYNADELLWFLREDALGWDEVITAVITALTTGQKRERLKREAAFWINVRWDATDSYCMALARKGPCTAVSATRPADVSAAIRWLLLDAWRDRFVDEWVRENARNYITVDDPSIQESVIDLEIFLRKLESGEVKPQTQRPAYTGFRMEIHSPV